MSEFCRFNLKTKEASKRTWKTYKHASASLEPEEIVVTKGGAEWCIRHPEWCDDRLKMALGEIDSTGSTH